jgi:hypothetical protein
MLRRRHRVLLGAVVIPAAVVLALVLSFSGGAAQDKAMSAGKYATSSGGDPDAQGAAATPGLGPAAAEAYESAARTYPANVIPTSFVANAEATFEQIANQSRGSRDGGGDWQQYGPKTNAFQPGVLAFSGANNTTASRTTAMVIAPTCKPGRCRLWVGTSGGGVWRTDNALAPNPRWEQVTHSLEQNSVGTLQADPNDPSGNTLYLGTGEANRCSSGCEAGVGVYKTRNGGNSWTKLPDVCVDNATYPCATPGKDSFLGRGIADIVVDPTNANHIYVGSAQGVRGLSHVIGNGGTTRLEPGANLPGVYESTNGGNTFTRVWDGNRGAASFGINDLALDPQDPTTLYASAFDAGLWRRSPTLDGATTQFDFKQVFAPQFVPPACNPAVSPVCAFLGVDRTMIAPTVKNGKTRIYLTEGTQNLTGNTGDTAAFWRTDNANQPAAALLATQAAGSTAPAPPGNPFPATYNGWQKLTSNTTASPYYATNDFCTGQCWYDQRVYTPKGLPDTVYVIGSYNYNELPCNTKGVGCGNGRSNGRGVVYSTTAGDPDASVPGDAVNRTFTDLTYDGQNTPASWCALDGAQQTVGGVTPPFQCLWAPNGIHPDQHQIMVNPDNPTQIFESSDGGVIRTDGTFDDISAHCNSGERPLLGAASLTNCKRLLSRVPNEITHINRKLSSTLQFINVAINPALPCEVEGGTQDNGTWSNNTGCPKHTWPQVIYGDGGNAGYDKTEPTWRWNEFTSGFSDSNFRNGDPTKWVITSAPVANSGEGPAFYWPQVGDPNPVPGTHPIYSGAKHVWRTWAFGAGTPAKVPQDTTPNIAFYEANCQEFTVSGTNRACGDYEPLGGPMCDGIETGPDATVFPTCINQPGDLTGTVYGADRSGGSLSWVARSSVDHGTLWAATSAGRIFVTHNADAVDPAAVKWHRIDNASSPTRFPSSIYTDPSNPNRAWITYSGYNAVTPATPGHVFSVNEGGSIPGSGVFTNLHVESGTDAFPTPTDDGDLPVSDVVRDDNEHVLYVGTDFGVLKGKRDGTAGWVVMTGLPRYEIMHLAIQPSAREATCTGGSHCKPVLYAATHSQGIWKLRLDDDDNHGHGHGH